MNISVRRPFGLLISAESARDIACAAIRQRPDDDVALVVTPNIDHIATIRRSLPLARAYQHAARIVCDGWPVQLYARLCSHRVARVTGCEITSELMRMAPYPTWQRFFFVVDSAATEQAVRQWAVRSSVACEVKIPPFGFERDAEYCQQLATSIAAHDTTVLIMAVGAPRSEVFVDTHRAILPRCWALCVGQAVKIELGLVRRAPSGWQTAGLEWLWRLLQEPSRLTKRYVTAAIGFSAAVVADQMRNMRERRLIRACPPERSETNVKRIRNPWPFEREQQWQAFDRRDIRQMSDSQNGAMHAAGNQSEHEHEY